MTVAMLMKNTVKAHRQHLASSRFPFLPNRSRFPHARPAHLGRRRPAHQRPAPEEKNWSGKAFAWPPPTPAWRRLAQEAREKPDLILLDVMMPDMDGIEVCHRLQAARKPRGIPVIFITARSTKENKFEGLGVGAVDYITKPIDLDETLARVQTQLAVRRGQPSGRTNSPAGSRNPARPRPSAPSRRESPTISTTSSASSSATSI
jgi:CheY-like chemotaxis protein